MPKSSPNLSSQLLLVFENEQKDGNPLAAVRRVYNKIADFHEIDRSRRPDRIGISYLVLIPNGTSHSLHRSTEPILVHIISFFELHTSVK